MTTRIVAIVAVLVVAVVAGFVGWAYYTSQPAVAPFKPHPGPHIKHDAQEDDPVVGPIIRKAGQEADELLKDEKARHVWLGWCHIKWAKQKAILKEKHGIDWRTPAEMNPHIAFD